MKTLFRNDLNIDCPFCKKQLKRGDYSSKYIEDREVEKDREIRKKVLSMWYKFRYNKNPDEFLTVLDYYDYLEVIENTIEGILSQKNLEALHILENSKEKNILEIEKNDAKRKERLKELYEKSLIDDSIYNENLKEEATRILERKEDEVIEEVVIKEMPKKMSVDLVFFS